MILGYKNEFLTLVLSLITVYSLNKKVGEKKGELVGQKRKRSQSKAERWSETPFWDLHLCLWQSNWNLIGPTVTKNYKTGQDSHWEENSYQSPVN